MTPSADPNTPEPAGTKRTFVKLAHRYELRVDGVVAAFADYANHGSTVVLPHTVTEPAFRGQGLAGVLVAYVLDELAAAQQSVIPACSYVAHFIETHPKYQSLLVD